MIGKKLAIRQKLRAIERKKVMLPKRGTNEINFLNAGSLVLYCRGEKS